MLRGLSLNAIACLAAVTTEPIRSVVSSLTDDSGVFGFHATLARTSGSRSDANRSNVCESAFRCLATLILLDELRSVVALFDQFHKAYIGEPDVMCVDVPDLTDRFDERKFFRW
jgi:hypothetical protein